MKIGLCIVCESLVIKPRDLHKSFDNLDCYLRYLSVNSSVSVYTVFSFFIFKFANEKRETKSFSFFVFKFAKEKRIPFSFFSSNLRTKNDFVFHFFVFKSEVRKKIPNSFFVRKFENEKRKRRYIHGPSSHVFYQH